MILKPIAQFISSNLNEMRDATLWSVWLSIPAMILGWAYGWAINSENIDYVRVILSAIAVDHIFGSIAHLKWFKGDFSILKNLAGLGIKITVVILMGSIFDGLTTLVVKEDLVYRYLLLVTRLMVFLYPAMSAMKNCHTITKGVFPPEVFIKKSDRFSKTLDINIFKNQEEDEDK